MRYFLFSLICSLGFVSKSLAFTDFDVCDHCYTTAQFAHAAEQRSLSIHPGMQGLDEVYVVNPWSADVRFFYVYRSFDAGFDPLGSGVGGGALSSGSARPAQGHGKLSGGFFVAEAVEGDGDPNVKTMIEDAAAMLSGAFEIWTEQIIQSGEVPGLENLESALQLVGPGSAEFWRNQVGVALEDYMNARIATRLGTIFNDALIGAFQKLVVESILIDSFEIVLKAPDGTEIKITYTINIRLGTLDDGYNFQILEHTVRLSDQPTAFPTTSGGFSGYSFTGSPELTGFLLDLANRLSEPSCDWECPAVDSCKLSCSRN